MSSLKQRTASSRQQQEEPAVDSTSNGTTTPNDDQQQPEADITPPPPPPRQSAASLALASTAHLANLLPTGTLLTFQFLTPIFTNNGTCDTVTKVLTISLFIFLAASCFFASFTDSFQSPVDKQVYYGVITFKGMWLFDYPGSGPDAAGVPDLRKYKLRFIDWVHAVLSVLVFGVVALRDRNVVSCLYPQPSREVKEVLDIVPIGVGFVCSLLFVAFPTKRHGIGYPVTAGKL